MKNQKNIITDDLSGKLVAFFDNKFSGVYLPSHNLEHHVRVWTFAIEILNHLRAGGNDFNAEFITGLHIACMTHDMGMIFDNGEMHGKAGRELAEEFIAQNGIMLSFREELLNAVEYHDRKDYSGISSPASLATILSVADDLDAFGYVGVYRYIEIYLKRGIEAIHIAESVKPNLTSRFMHMKRVYGFMDDFIRKHTRRYELAADFFNPEGRFSLSLKRKIIQIVLEETDKNHTDISTISRVHRNSEHEDISIFFNALHKELIMAEYI